MTEFSLDWPHGWQTRDGRKVDILKADVPGSYPIVGLILTGGEHVPCSWSVDGRWSLGPSSSDIINAPAPKPEPRKWWVNVYTNMTGYVWSGQFVESREVADSRADVEQNTRIACVCITEGDGLEGDK